MVIYIGWQKKKKEKIESNQDYLKNFLSSVNKIILFLDYGLK